MGCCGHARPEARLVTLPGTAITYTIWLGNLWLGLSYRFPILGGDEGQRACELLREIARANEITVYAGAIDRDACICSYRYRHQCRFRAQCNFSRECARRVLTKDSPGNRGFLGEGVKVVVEVVVDPQRQIDHFDDFGDDLRAATEPR
jgi:hypothetical protein